MKEKSWLNFSAWFVFVAVVVNLLSHLYIWHGYWWEIFWYCDAAALVLSIGIWLRKSSWVTVVLTSAIPLQFLWILDFFLELSGHGIGRTAWLFAESKGVWISGLSTLLHGILIPTSLLAVYKMGFHKKALIYNFFTGILLLGSTYFFTAPRENINCVFFPCDIDYSLAYLQATDLHYFTLFFVIKQFIISIFTIAIVYVILLFWFRKRLVG